MRLGMQNPLHSIIESPSGREAAGTEVRMVEKWGKGRSFVVQDKGSAAQCRRSAVFSSQLAPFFPLAGQTSRPLHSAADVSQAAALQEQPFSIPGLARRALMTGVGVAIVTTSLIVLGTILRLRISLTDSAAPAGVYRLIPTETLHRGELVAACLPASLAQQGLSRGYLRGGDCPAGAEPIAKILGALPGDVVKIEPRGVEVDGALFARSAIASTDSNGRSLPHVDWGTRKALSGEVWLFGFNNSRSWDSRYYGPIPFSHIRGELRPILTW